MQTTTTNESSVSKSALSTRPRHGAFHKVGLSFGNAGAIVRRDNEGKIYGIIASWMRTRNQGVDSVFVITPAAMLGAAEELIQEVTLTGADFKNRFDLFLVPDRNVTDYMESQTEGGSWGVILMNRVGQWATFSTTMYDLDAHWRANVSESVTIGKLADHLAAGFQELADSMLTGWPILYAAAALFGGQDPDEMPEGPSEIPTSLAAAVSLERRFRSNQKRVRSLSPEALDAFRATLSGEQSKALDSLMEGKRDHVGA